MKEGIYIRLVPITGMDSFYLYHNGILHYLGIVLGKPCEINWNKSTHDKPSKELGFKYIKELSE